MTQTMTMTITSNIRGREIELEYAADIADQVAAIVIAAGEDGVIQAGDMVDLFPGQPSMHSTTMESTALLAAGCSAKEELF